MKYVWVCISKMQNPDKNMDIIYKKLQGNENYFLIWDGKSIKFSKFKIKLQVHVWYGNHQSAIGLVIQEA